MSTFFADLHVPTHDDMSFTLSRNGYEREPQFTDVALPRISSVFREEVRVLSEDIHKIIQQTRNMWDEVCQHELNDFEYPVDYELPPVKPMASKYVKTKVACKEEGEVDLSFLDEFEYLFD